MLSIRGGGGKAVMCCGMIRMREVCRSISCGSTNSELLKCSMLFLKFAIIELADETSNRYHPHNNLQNIPGFNVRIASLLSLP